MITESLFAVELRLVRPDEFSGSRFSVSFGEEFDFGPQDQDISSQVFEETSSRPTASLSLPADILMASGVSNATRITRAVFLTDSAFLRRDNNYFEVGSVVMATEVVGTNVTGLSSPIELTFLTNPVRLFSVYFHACGVLIYLPFTFSEVAKCHEPFLYILG